VAAPHSPCLLLLLHQAAEHRCCQLLPLLLHMPGPTASD
jgi:hypothetical protein